MPTESFGQLLRELRVKNREYLSLREFAKKVGLSPAYLSRIENGKEPPPSEAVVERLAEALGTDKYELFSHAGKVPTEFLETFKKNPRGMASFMRRVKEVGLETNHEWEELESSLSQVKRKRKNDPRYE
jgi:HTH-type transcriptional regulator, competence development regulator